MFFHAYIEFGRSTVTELWELSIGPRMGTPPSLETGFSCLKTACEYVAGIGFKRS